METNGRVEAVYLDVRFIEPNEWNPYKMDKFTFDSLLENIKEQGFDDPLTVVKLGENRYRVIDGEHRLAAAVALGYKEVPCIIKEEIAEDDQKLQTIRRNHIRGDVDKKKFSRLVKDYCDKNKVDQSIIASKMAFKNEKEFQRYIVDKKKKDKELLGIVSKEDKLVGNRLLKKLVEDILDKNVDNLARGYLQFAYKGKEYLSIQMSKETHDIFIKVINYVTENGGSVEGFLRKALMAEIV